MNHLPNSVCLCLGCGYFFDILTGKIADVKYSDIDADLALEVMRIRKKPQSFCHVRKCATANKVRGNGFGKPSK